VVQVADLSSIIVAADWMAWSFAFAAVDKKIPKDVNKQKNETEKFLEEKRPEKFSIHKERLNEIISKIPENVAENIVHDNRIKNFNRIYTQRFIQIISACVIAIVVVSQLSTSSSVKLQLGFFGVTKARSMHLTVTLAVYCKSRNVNPAGIC
jgi:hypothetical protein